jgi:hypothetical protein
MPVRVAGENRKHAIAQVVTAMSCAALLWSTLERPPGRQPLPGTRTAIELLASGSHRALPKVAPSRVMT